MGYEVDYTTIKDEFQRREQALKDMKSYLGTKKFKELSRIALQEKEKGYRRQDIAITMEMFAGMSGFPIEVWLDFLGFYPQTPNNSATTVKTQADAPPLG